MQSEVSQFWVNDGPPCFFWKKKKGFASPVFQFPIFKLEKQFLTYITVELRGKVKEI